LAYNGYSQCTLNLFSNPDTLICGECATLSAFGSMDGNVAFQEDFNSGNPVGWQFTQSVTIANNTCGVPSPDNSPFMWMGDAAVNPRDMTTVGFDLTLGGTICFEMRYSIQGDASPCEGPDEPDEGVFLQYSTDNGVTWITINYWDPNGGNDPGLTSWNQYCAALPLGALTTNTMIRWHQDDVSGTDFDHWGIDNVIITLNDPNSVITWLHDGFAYPMGSSGGDDPTQVCITTNTTYTAEITNGVNTCSQNITVFVKNPTILVTADPDTTLCPGECADLIGVATVIISPASTPTFSNAETDFIIGNFALPCLSFGGCNCADGSNVNFGDDCAGNFDASMNINVQGLNSTTVNTSSITSVCITDYVINGGCGALSLADVEIVLICPSGTEVILANRGSLSGMSITNMCFELGTGAYSASTSPYSGTFSPINSWIALNGCNSNGVWTLELRGANSETCLPTGSVDGWSISFDDPEISYPANLTWSPTTNMTNSTTLNPNICPVATTTYTLSATDVNNCVIETDDVTVTVGACVCTITSLTAVPGACNPGTDTYDLTGTITFTTPPAVGTLTVTDCHGGTQVFNAPFVSPLNYSITGIASDGVACNATAVFSADAACTFTTNYNAQPSCVGACTLSGLTTVTTACVSATNTYDLSGVITFSTPPAVGTLTITDCHGGTQVFNAPFVSPLNYNITGIASDGVACNATAVFSADAACTITTNYNAPAACTPGCAFTNLIVNVGSCNPNSTYDISGTLTFNNPPGAGALTITNVCSGTDTIINAPFASPLNWTISGLPTGAGTCDVSAVFSADPACTISLGLANEYPIVIPCGCVANVGTFTTGIAGSGTTDYQLCFGDQFTMTSNGDNVDPAEELIPVIPAPNGYNPGIGYLVYSCPPTIATVPSNIAPNDNIANDPCFVGVVGFGNNFSDLNFLGAPSYAGPWINNTIYYVPITFYDTISDGTAIDPVILSWTATTLPCYSMGQPFAVQYLTQITSAEVTNCVDSSVTVTISGGLPETDGSLYTGSNLLPVTASFVNTTATHNGTIVINGLQDGDLYSFDVVDTNGCPITITGGPFVGLPNADANVDDTSCTLTYNLNATPSIGTGAWTGPVGIVFGNATSATSTATATTAGTYTLTWTETNTPGCVSSDNMDITFNILSIPNTLTNPLCNNSNNGQIILAPQGGTTPYTYQWDAAAGNQITNPATNLPAGTFTVRVTDNFGCFLDSTFTLTEPGPFTFTVDSTNANCGNPDGTATVIGFSGGTGAYTYQWDAAAANQTTNPATGLIPGTYTVTVSDAAIPTTCDTTFSITVLNTPAFVATITGFTDATCNGFADGTATADGLPVAAGYTYQWDAAAANQVTQTATGLSIGTYTVIITDPATGCTDDTTVTIDEPTLVVVTATSPITICSGQDTNLLATATAGTGNGGPYTYNWNSGAFIGNPYLVAPTADITYTVFAMDVDGCSSAPVNINVVVGNPLVVTGGLDQIICAGETATITATASVGAGNGGPYTYTWDNSLGQGQTQAVSPTIPGTHPYIVTLDDGCTFPLATATVMVTVNPLPVINFMVDDTNACESAGQLFTFYNIPGPTDSTLTWDFGDGQGIAGLATNFDPNVDTVTHFYPAAPGVYDVTLTVTTDSIAGNCSNSLTKPAYITIFQNPIADFLITPNPTTMFDPVFGFVDQSVAFSPPIMSYAWDIAGIDSATGSNFIYTFPEDTGNYNITLTVTDVEGCKNTITQIAIVTGEFGIYVPNAFTPDFDGLNDGFFPTGFGIAEQEYVFLIYDRWGEKIFESHKKFEPWNGTYKNKLVPNGVYVWKLNFNDLDGDNQSRIGHVTIVK